MKKWIILCVPIVSVMAASEAPVSEAARQIEALVRSISESDHGFDSDLGGPSERGRVVLEDSRNLTQELGRLLDVSFPLDVRESALVAMERRKEYDPELFREALGGWLEKYKDSEIQAVSEPGFERNYYFKLVDAIIAGTDSGVVDVALSKFPIKDDRVAGKTVEMVGQLGNERHLQALQELAGQSEGELKEKILQAAAKVGSRKPPEAESRAKKEPDKGAVPGSGSKGVIAGGVALLAILLGYVFWTRRRRA